MAFSRLEQFELWLRHRGAEILPTTNEYEALRFKGTEVGVLYKSGKYSGNYARKAYECFRSNLKWDGRPLKTGRKGGYVKEKRQLLKRDGSDCFFCGYPLMDDITLEHLISLASGGKNELSNMVLAHEVCNQAMSGKLLNEKVQFAIENRIKRAHEETIIPDSHR